MNNEVVNQEEVNGKIMNLFGESNIAGVKVD
jgi:hypothetical protein